LAASRLARLLAAALALAGCASSGAVRFEPHVAWPVSDDAGWATAPTLGVTAFGDERPAELRSGYRPGLHLRRLGIAREGVQRTGDADFSRPVAEGVRDDVLATLQRAGTFASVTRVDFDPRDPAAWPESGAPPLVLTGAIETFEGRQWRSFGVSPLQVGFVRERWGPAQGSVSLHVELWSKAERLWEARISARHDSLEDGADAATLEALALAAEKLAVRLDARLRGRRPEPPRVLEVRVLDGCELGDARVRRLVSEASAIFEREAGVVLVGTREPWDYRPRGAGVDELLEQVQRFAPHPGGVVLGLAPAAQAHELALGSVRTGLAVPLGAHALALCAGEDEVSVLTAAHELAHLFGAVHVRDPASIMHATADFDARLFDPLNRRIVRSLRTRDFSRPLDARESAQLAALYREAEQTSGLVDERDVTSARRALEAPEP
jgi:hypothetical protein